MRRLDVRASRLEGVRRVESFRLLEGCPRLSRVRGITPSVRARINSSVAIQAKPASATRGTIASDTEPSEGHNPTGRRPNSRSWQATARMSCSTASSGCTNRWRGMRGIRVRAQVHVGVAEEGQNGVIKRRGGDSICPRAAASRYSGITILRISSSTRPQQSLCPLRCTPPLFHQAADPGRPLRDRTDPPRRACARPANREGRRP